MSRLGVWQCVRLTLNVCEWGGSSRGARAFRERFLPQLRADNPQLELVEAPRPGKHPFLEAKYRNGNTRVVDVKNKEPEEILRQAYLLRSAAGRNTRNALPRHVLPKVRAPGSRLPERASPSVQGRWQPAHAA